MRRYLSLILFLLLSLGGGVALSAFSARGAWYAALAKPPFTPPDWLFGPVWTALYIFIAIAGWRTWQRDRGGMTMKIWWAQMALNFLWTPMFFGAHQIGLALAITLSMLSAILSFVALSWRNDGVAAALFIPYAAWVAFATVLNGAILTLN